MLPVHVDFVMKTGATIKNADFETMLFGSITLITLMP